jgi:hypothetical protein
MGEEKSIEGQTLLVDGFLRPVNLVYCLLLLTLATYSISFLNRFPWQDLLYADFLLLNALRWGSQNIIENGPVAWLMSTIDFREGLGENVFASIKSSPSYLDIAIYLSVLAGPNIAIITKRIVYSALCIVACYYIGKRNHAEGRMEFYLFTSAIVLMPELYTYGLFNETGLLMIPPLYLSIDLLSERFGPWRYAFFAAILALFAGASDLFFFFNILSVFAFFLLLNPAKWRIVVVLGAVSGLFGAVHFGNVFLERIFPSGSYIGNSGSWTLGYYINEFWRKLYTGVIAPEIVGPVMLFTTVFVFPYVVATLVSRNRRALWGIAAVIVVFAIQTALSFLLHGVPELTGKLPSAVRYNYPAIAVLLCIVLLSNPLEFRTRTIIAATVGWGIWLVLAMKAFPLRDTLIFNYHDYIIGTGLANADTLHLITLFSIASLSPLVWLAGTRSDGNTWRNEGRTVAFAAMPLLVYGTNVGLSYTTVSLGSAHYSNGELSRWLSDGVQSCITRVIAQSSYADETRSFVFVASKFAPNYPYGRHDLIMSILEQPEKLGGRTFNHWRYGHAPVTSRLYATYTRASWNTWPPTFDNPEKVAGLAAATFSPFVIAAGATPLPKDFVPLGSCPPPVGLSQLAVEMNPTLKADIYIYYYAGYRALFPQIASATFQSSYATFELRTSANATVPMNGVSLPIAYHSGLKARLDDEVTPVLAGADGYASVNRAAGGSHIVIASRRSSAPMSLLAALLLGILWPVLELFRGHFASLQSDRPRT